MFLDKFDCGVHNARSDLLETQWAMAQVRNIQGNTGTALYL